MAVLLEQFVKQLEDSGIIAGDTLKEFIPPKASPKDAEELALELIRQKKLTKFQAEEISRGNANSLVLGNYVLMDKIGEGGMGQVFKAQHRRMDRIVAIKMLPPAISRNVAAVTRFEREAKAAAKLLHPNIVTAFDADQANGIHFLVMQYVEGQDLSALVKKGGPVPFDKAVNYILQAARGLEFAHRMGVVHRDIKPSNLLLDEEGQVKILDMGLARIETPGIPTAVQAELTDSGAVIGTVDYMSPEQAFNTKHADARADIYSLGCSLYYLMTGKATYAGETVIERILAHREKPIPSLRDAQPGVPIELEVVFRKMLAKKVEARYQSMSEVVGALERSTPASPGSQSNQQSSNTALDDDALAFLLDEDALAFLKKSADGQTIRTRTAKKKPADKADTLKKNRSELDVGKTPATQRSGTPAVEKLEHPPPIGLEPRPRLFTRFRLVTIAIMVIAGLTGWVLWRRDFLDSAEARVSVLRDAGMKALNEGDFATAARQLKLARDAVDSLNRQDRDAKSIRRSCNEAIAGDGLSTIGLFQLLADYVAETRRGGNSLRFDSRYKGAWLLLDSSVLMPDTNSCYLDAPIVIDGVTFRMEIDSPLVRAAAKRAGGDTGGRVIFAAQLDHIRPAGGGVSEAVLSLIGKSAVLWSSFETYSALGYHETDPADLQATRDVLAGQLKQMDGSE